MIVGPFPFLGHRILAEVAKTERLRDLAQIKGRRFSKFEMRLLEAFTALERANNPPPDNAA
jgi:hypothetical protein